MEKTIWYSRREVIDLIGDFANRCDGLHGERIYNIKTWLDEREDRNKKDTNEMEKNGQKVIPLTSPLKYKVLPEPNRLYRHYKGGLYEFITMAIHSETKEELVIYKSLHY